FGVKSNRATGRLGRGAPLPQAVVDEGQGGPAERLVRGGLRRAAGEKPNPVGGPGEVPGGRAQTNAPHRPPRAVGAPRPRGAPGRRRGGSSGGGGAGGGAAAGGRDGRGPGPASSALRGGGSMSEISPRPPATAKVALSGAKASAKTMPS